MSKLVMSLVTSLNFLPIFYCRIVDLSESYTSLIQEVSGIGLFDAFSHITDSIQKVCNNILLVLSIMSSPYNSPVAI